MSRIGLPPKRGIFDEVLWQHFVIFCFGCENKSKMDALSTLLQIYIIDINILQWFFSVSYFVTLTKDSFLWNTKILFSKFNIIGYNRDYLGLQGSTEWNKTPHYTLCYNNFMLQQHNYGYPYNLNSIRFNH